MKVAIESPISDVTVDDLAKQVKQEPVAWMQDSIELYVLEEKSAIRGYVIPLYTAPPKREPPMTQREAYQRGYAQAEMDLKRKHLTDIEISKGFKADDEATHLYSYWAGVEFAEKHHGIGGGE